MTKKTQKNAHAYARKSNSMIAGHLNQIILFGSQARGDAWAGYDFDVLVVVDKRTPEIKHAITEAGAQMGDDYDTLFGAISYSLVEWQGLQNPPLAWNRQREGSVL